MSEIKRVFQVGGQPFFPLGGQARNSSGYNAEESEAAFRAVKAVGGNTLEVPMYWQQIEPDEGRFDFAPVDSLLAQAQKHGLKLVLLWFGAWKNGDMDYTPDWVKTNPARFKRVVGPTGRPIWVLSPHCAANYQADERAFVALCRYLKVHDTEGAVIALQIENEPGALGSDRDYGPDGEADFRRPVPGDLMAKLKQARQGSVYDLWRQAGGKGAGSWEKVFGAAGGEFMSAWRIATYIDALAAAGKAILNIPMYLNVWLGQNGWRIPGESYPSGGAVSKTLDIYKWCAPHIDLIAPDIYIGDARGYEAVCADYNRPDNALFIPESAPGGTNAWLMFRAIGAHNAIGYACFGIERILAPDGTVRPETQPLADSFRCVAAAIPLLLKYQGTGQMHTLVQEEGAAAATLDFDGYMGRALYKNAARAVAAQDWRHMPNPAVGEQAQAGVHGCGFIFQVSRHEFYLVGYGYRLVLRPKTDPAVALDATLTSDFLLTRQSHYVTVDEGHFDAAGNYVVDRRRNGDEVDHGMWLEADTGVVHVVMTD